MKISLKKGRARCYTKLPTVQDMLQSILGLVSLPICDGDGDGICLMHVMW